LDICVLNPFFYPYRGGTENVLFEVYKRLAKKHNITVITSASNDRNKHSVEDMFGIKVIRLRTFQEHIPLFPLPFLFFDGLTKELSRARCDIYHINNRYQYFEDSVFAIRRMNRKIALTIHNALPKNIDPLTDDLGLFYDRFWGRKLMRYADVITGVSTNTINTTVPRSERYKTHMVFNGVDNRKFRPIGNNDKNVTRILDELKFDDGINIMTNGRLVTQKGQSYLIRAFAELVNRDKENLNLLIVGSGPLLKPLKKMAKENGVSDRVRILHGIGDSLPYYYNACKIYSMPSLYEPAGLALLEAMSCGIPSVISRIGGMPEIAGNCALYTRPKDYRSIKKKIRYLLDNQKAASMIARKGRDRMIKYHNWDKIAKQYESLFLRTIRY